ncbi:MAG: DHH family phosphoesterase [Eubacteriales bacterium]|nr:DHH family phosphoesterase [Eubacteriales bacterium]
MKNKTKEGWALSIYLSWPLILSVIMVLVNLALIPVSRHAAAIMGVFTAAYVLIGLWMYFYTRRGLFAGLMNFASGFNSVQQRLMRDMNMPVAICDTSGGILWKNRAFRELLHSENISIGNIQAAFPDITKEILLNSENEDAIVHSSLGKRRYGIELIWTRLAEDGETDEEGFFAETRKEVVVCYLTDETEQVRLKKQYQDSKMCLGLISLDNYDEALETVEDVRSSLLTALVDRKISNYISSMEGIVKKLEKDKYIFMVMDRYINKMKEDRFSILEDVKAVNIGNNLPLTLSIGIGMEGRGYRENYEAARASMDLALGRGGDQVVLKSGSQILYFGGKAQAVEKNTRVKARVKAQAFKELLESKDKMIVMGHKNGDVDSLGSSIGFWKIATALGKKAYIVIGPANHSVKPLRMRFTEEAGYSKDMFVDGNRALELLDSSTMVVVTDVNRPSYTEEPRLLAACDTIVVLDHHRKSSETIDTAVLSYVEPFASSASEMVAEIIQYIGDDGIKLTPQEADAMYSGIVIDTQNFTNQTGVRTFEAAAFLRRSGADVVRIRKMFRENLADYKAKADAVDKAEIYQEHFAISVCDAEGTEAPTVVGAQAANSLLEIRGIKASVVMTEVDGKIYLSARSIDEVNVQVMMEKLGGGGHKTVAGAQFHDITIDEAREKVKLVIDEMLREGEVS